MADVMDVKVDPGDGEIQQEAPRRVRSRPRAGLTLVCLGGLAIIWIPGNLYWLAFVPGSFAFAGLLFGALVLACGVLGWLMPRYVRLLGAFAMIISIVSIIGALGGMVVGTLLSVIGGALCIAWSPETRAPRLASDGAASGRDGGGEIWTLPSKEDRAWSRWYR
ncbi:MAG: DUF6114 domain-containing protein [Alicyclobacillaceae bacterium]|nr:DUF6114 domain-containing protein [Alicyclobacillaceae bacterium]